MWELHGFKAHLRVVLGCEEGLGGGGSTEQGGSAAEASDGEGAPVRIGRGEAVGELREGSGGGRPRRVGASARRINGRDGREGAGGRRCRWTATRSGAGRWRWKKRAVLQFPKIPGTIL